MEIPFLIIATKPLTGSRLVTPKAVETLDHLEKLVFPSNLTKANLKGAIKKVHNH